MANTERGEVSVTVGGKKYTLRPSFDSLCELEDLTGKGWDEWQECVQRRRLSGLRAVIWCLLQDKHADEFKTLKAASAWIEHKDVGGIDGALDIANRIVGLNADETAGDAPENPQHAQASTGETSTLELVTSA